MSPKVVVFQTQEGDWAVCRVVKDKQILISRHVDRAKALAAKAQLQRDLANKSS